MKPITMKKLLLFLACFLPLTVFSQQKPELTDAQKASITAEIKVLFDEVQTAAVKGDTETFFKYWSEDNFIGTSSGVTIFSDLDEVKRIFSQAWSNREKQKFDPIETTITPLAPDLVLVTRLSDGNILFKSGDRYIFKHLVSSLWKKEKEGWKIIYNHESSEKYR